MKYEKVGKHLVRFLEGPNAGKCLGYSNPAVKALFEDAPVVEEKPKRKRKKVEPVIEVEDAPGD